MLLALDTSTNQIGIACYSEAGVLAECVWDSLRDHTTQLLPQIDTMIGYIGKCQLDLQAVAVALGPGSWSGLRVGLSTAKGLALALEIPIIGISTLDLLAYQHSGTGLPVVPVIRLGRDRLAISDGPGTAARNTTLAALGSEIPGRALFCGDIDSEIRAALAATLGDRARFVSGAAAVRRPSYLAELAWRRFQNNDSDDLATLEPIYLGQPVRLAQA
jgi:tRNA threonylcarbamoyladenosine biosynthesis protein TsaB